MKARRPTGRAVLIAVAVVSVLFATVAQLMVLRAESSAQSQLDAQDEATGSASESLPEILGYKYATIEDDLDAATDLMTKDFAKQYSELSPQLVSTAQQRKIDVTATVRNIAALECGQECSTSSVRVLAFVDQHRTIAGTAASPAALSIVVRMKKVEGQWLVADLSSS